MGMIKTSDIRDSALKGRGSSFFFVLHAAGIRLSFVLFLLFPLAVHAEPNACYTLEEAAAERLLRLHSELMVITVTCKQGSYGQPLGPVYASFTRRNLEELRRAEKIMQNHYEKCAKGKGLERLDSLRTRLANDFGQNVATDSAPVFCALRRDRVVAMNEMPARHLKVEANAAYAAAPTLEPLCPQR